MKTAKDIMTSPVHTVTEQTTLDELAAAFRDKRVSGFPVVDGSGELVGVVTESDLLHLNQRLHIPTAVAIFDAVIYLGSSKSLEQEMRRLTATDVGQIMVREPRTVRETATVQQVATLMAEEHVHTLPVLDEDGNLVGIIGKIDVISSTAAQ